MIEKWDHNLWNPISIKVEGDDDDYPTSPLKSFYDISSPYIVPGSFPRRELLDVDSHISILD